MVHPRPVFPAVRPAGWLGRGPALGASAAPGGCAWLSCSRPPGRVATRPRAAAREPGTSRPRGPPERSSLMDAREWAPLRASPAGRVLPRR